MLSITKFFPPGTSQELRAPERQQRQRTQPDFFFICQPPPRGSGRVSPWPKLLWGMKKSKLFTLTLKLWTKIVLKTLTYRYLGLTTDPPGSGRIRGNPITGVEKKPARDEGAARPAIHPTATIHPPCRAQGGAMCH